MKKLITLVMLSILTVINASAAETILWEGDYNVDWDLTPADNPNREWKGLIPADFAAMATGQKLYFYFAPAGEDYHKYNFDNYSWNALPGHEGEHDSEFGFSGYVKVEFEVTQDVKDEIVANGFALHGHGFHVIRVTTLSSETPAAIKWNGNQTIRDWSGDDGKCLKLTIGELGITEACTLYVLAEKVDPENNETGIKLMDNNWEANKYTHNTEDNYDKNYYVYDVNDIIKIDVKQWLVDIIKTEEWKNILFWGNNMRIKAISTSKYALLQYSKGLLVNLDANGFATFSSAWKLDLANLPDGLEAYTGSLSGNTLSFVQKTTAVAAETGLLLKGTAWNPYKIPVTLDDAETVSGNALQANVVETSRNSDGSNSIYVMKKATTAGDLKFLKLTSAVNVPANRAYVLVTGAGAHELNVSFGDGETTGINAVKSDGFMMNGYYDLQGRKVAQPTKGLYIVNGKKVVIK